MAPILIDEGLDLGQFGDLMDQGFGVVAVECVTTAATGGRLADERVADLLGRDQAPPGLAMAGLAAAFFPAGRSWGFPLHANRIGRGGLGRVRGVELEPCFEATDPRLQLIDPLPHHQERGGDSRLGVWRHLGPEFSGDGQWIDHEEGIVSSSATFNTGL